MALLNFAITLLLILEEQKFSLLEHVSNVFINELLDISLTSACSLDLTSELFFHVHFFIT